MIHAKQANSRDRAQAIRSVRLDRQAITELLDRLDARDEAEFDAQRAWPRFPYRHFDLHVYLKQPGSPTFEYLVTTRNLSIGGVAFLHGGFLHPGSRCVVDLITSHGVRERVAGTIARCDYLEGNIHEVGLRLDQAIDPATFTPKAIRPKVLLVDDDDDLRRLARFYLEQYNAEVMETSDGAEALALTRENTFDLILLDMLMPGLDGFQAVRILRSEGYGGCVVATTGLTSDEQVAACLTAGCDQHLAKPFSKTAFEQVLVSLADRPLLSTHHNNPSMHELLRNYVQHMQTQLIELRQAVAQNDAQTVRDHCLRLKANGASFGFQPITLLATKIEFALRHDQALDDVRSQVLELINRCSSIRAPA